MNELNDYAWLTACETAPLLEELAVDTAPLHSQLNRLRKFLRPEQARLAVGQVALRHRAHDKFGELAARIFFTETTLEQSTDLWIARYKASRFPQGATAIDFCSGIGGDLLGLASRGRTIGYDRCEIIALLANANLRAAGLSDNGEVCVGTAEDHPPGLSDHWHVDPDRRTDGQRSTQLRWHAPNEETISRWLRDSPHGGIKLAPATQIPEDWEETVEQEWISRNRECRQLVLWSGSLARDPGQRRAIRIAPSDESGKDLRVDSYVGRAKVEANLTTNIYEFVYDTDPALRAARLTGSLACDLGLSVFGTGPSYLTSQQRIEHPLLSSFQVLDQFPFREKTLAQYLQQRAVGTLEIKKRDIEINPEGLRRRLKLHGDNQATLLLTRIGKREVAILADRCE